MTSDRDGFVFVALPGRSEYVVAGRFRVSATFGGAPLGEFVYGRSYLSRPDAVEFDPVQLRLTGRVRKTHGFNGVFGAIRDAMPTSWGRPIPDRVSRGKVPDEMDHVVQGPHERIGALVVAPGLEPPHPTTSFNAIDDLVRLQAIVDAELTRQDARQEAGTPQAQRLPFERTPKATVEDDRTLWLAKFTQDHAEWNQARVRHATLQLARDCGIDAIPSRVERLHGRDVLLVRRCDREWVGDGYACSRLVSGLTLLRTDATPAEKQRWSYLALADEVRRASSHPREDLCELFGRMCFNAAISSLNDHLAHPMMVAKGTGWRLAPAPGPGPASAPPVDGERGDFTMICGPAGRSPSRENLVGGARRFLLDRAAAEAIFDRISTTVQSSWYDVMRQSGVSAQDCDLVARTIVHSGD